MIVVADTIPLNYLVLIRQIDLLPRLFGKVLIPPAVFVELKDPETPPPVRSWPDSAPSWLQVHPPHFRSDPDLDYFDNVEGIDAFPRFHSPGQADCQSNAGCHPALHDDELMVGAFDAYGGVKFVHQAGAEPGDERNDRIETLL